MTLFPWPCSLQLSCQTACLTEKRADQLFFHAGNRRHLLRLHWRPEGNLHDQLHSHRHGPLLADLAEQLRAEPTCWAHLALLAVTEALLCCCAVIVYVIVLILMIKVFVPGQFLNGIDDVRFPITACWILPCWMFMHEF